MADGPISRVSGSRVPISAVMVARGVWLSRGQGLRGFGRVGDEAMARVESK